jgi:hypothetical protein
MMVLSDEAQGPLALDERLRDEADQVLCLSGLGEILQTERYEPVGSYCMHTMAWRDLDFERAHEQPNWSRHWELGTRLARLRWTWKLNCTDAYRQPGGSEYGLYWGLRLNDPAGGSEWKVDLWTARQEEFQRGCPNRARWASLLTTETRARIVAIKQAVCGLAEYRREILSVHIYEAVLDRDVRDIEGFKEWHRRRFQGTRQP